MRTLAVEELYALRDAITDDERGRIDFWSLRPGDNDRDLIGQICNGSKERVLQILHLIVVPFTNYQSLAVNLLYPVRRSAVAIEIYMATPWARNLTVVSFLKGERENLSADDL